MTALFLCILTFYKWRFGLMVTLLGVSTKLLRRAGLVLRWVTVRGYTVLISNQATHAHSSLSLAIPPRVGVLSTGDGYGHR